VLEIHFLNLEASAHHNLNNQQLKLNRECFLY
jgi:hypothetical protein